MPALFRQQGSNPLCTTIPSLCFPIIQTVILEKTWKMELNRWWPKNDATATIDQGWCRRSSLYSTGLNWVVQAWFVKAGEWKISMHWKRSINKIDKLSYSSSRSGPPAAGAFNFWNKISSLTLVVVGGFLIGRCDTSLSCCTSTDSIPSQHGDPFHFLRRSLVF